MADVAQILIEIAKKRGYEDGETADAIEKRGPIKMEERTIQVSESHYFSIYFSICLLWISMLFKCEFNNYVSA